VEPLQRERVARPLGSRPYIGQSGCSRGGALAWGLLWALIGAIVLNRLGPNPWTIQPNRAIELKDSLAVLNRGGPALLGYQRQTGLPYPIAYLDDQGIFVIVPVLSHWLGQSDPVAVLRSLWIAVWSFTLLSSAAVFGSIFRSKWAALLAPPVLLVCILSFGFGDIYWVSAWVAVTFMPALILLGRRRPRGLWAWLAAIALVSGVVTAIRSDAGLPVAIAAAAVAAMAGRRWPQRAAVVAVVAFAYLSPTLIGMPAIRAHRDARVKVDLGARAPTSHAIWHTVYIGLGYTSNRYGIHYLDSYGEAAAREADSQTYNGSAAFAQSNLRDYGAIEERAVHGQVTAIVEHDPGFLVRAELEKGLVELFLAAPYLLLLALLLPAALTARSPARLRRSELALFIPALVIGALPAVIAAPFRDYSLSLLGPLAALGLLAIGSLAARAQAEWSTIEAADSSMATRARAVAGNLVHELPGRATRRSLLVALAILIPVAVAARDLEAAHTRWDRRERNPPTVVLAATPLPTVVFAAAPTPTPRSST
jgi:hypothetical protein